MKIRYRLSAEGRRRAILEGRDPEPDLCVEFVPGEQPPEVRELFVDLDRRGCVHHDRVARVAELRPVGGALQEADFEVGPENVDALLRAALERVLDVERRRGSRLQDRADWVAENGSPALRKAANEGYEVQRQYAAERAALERPGYVPDLDGTAVARDRFSPSGDALVEAERVGGEVVWLRVPPHNPHDAAALSLASSFRPVEAVRILDWDGGCPLFCWDPARFGEGLGREEVDS